MNITLIQEQMAYIDLSLETEDEFEVYGGTTRAPFEFIPTGVASWRVVVRESEVAGAAIRAFDIYARQRSTGREWVVLSGRIFVKPRTADIEGDKLSPVEYHVTVPVVDSVTIGCKAATTAPDSVTLGASASNTNSGSILIGAAAKSEGNKSLTITLGSQFTETTDKGDVLHTCSTEGAGSITIGAGANTLNNGDTESSNSVTIGCKAENKGADSVVIGAGASTAGEGTIIIGAGTKLEAGSGTISNAILIGRGAKSTGAYAGGSLCIGAGATIKGDAAAALGARAVADTGGFALGTAATAGKYSTAIGYECQNANIGTTSFKQRKNGGQTYTQFYILAAESALATEYEDGEACMGYVVKNATTGELLAAGTQKLSVLFPNNSGFQPMALSLDDEMTPPKVFHPSDLDLPQEEPSEPEKGESTSHELEVQVYQPLPVYPIVEPTEDELRTPTQEI